jgi:hypothetical protein
MPLIQIFKKKIRKEAYESHSVTFLQNSGTSQHAPTDRIHSPPTIQVHTPQSAEPVSKLFTLTSDYLFGCLPSGRVILHDPHAGSNILQRLHVDGTSQNMNTGSGPAAHMSCFKTMVLSRLVSGNTCQPCEN